MVSIERTIEERVNERVDRWMIALTKSWWGLMVLLNALLGCVEDRINEGVDS